MEQTGLIKFDAAIHAIEQAKSIDEVKAIRDKAEACRMYAKQVGMSLEGQNSLAEIRLRAERRAGQMLKEMDRHKNVDNLPNIPKSHDVISVPTLKDMDITPKQSSRWQQEAKIDEEVFEGYIEKTKKDGELTTSGLLQIQKKWYQSSESPEWPTPQWLFDRLDEEFHFTLDVCATDKSAKCKKYYTIKDDGLSKEWEGICWMNPPYGKEIADWMAKAKEMARAGCTVVCLVPARPDTNWWWDNAIDGEIRFIRGRLKWPGSDTMAPFPSAVVVLDKNHESGVVWWAVKEEK